MKQINEEIRNINKMVESYIDYWEEIEEEGEAVKQSYWDAEMNLFVKKLKIIEKRIFVAEGDSGGFGVCV